MAYVFRGIFEKNNQEDGEDEKNKSESDKLSKFFSVKFLSVMIDIVHSVIAKSYKFRIPIVFPIIHCPNFSEKKFMFLYTSLNRKNTNFNLSQTSSSTKIFSPKTETGLKLCQLVVLWG